MHWLVRAGQDRVAMDEAGNALGIIRETLTVNVVLVRKSGPPDDEIAIEWILVTTLPISTLEEIRQVIRYDTEAG